MGNKGPGRNWEKYRRNYVELGGPRRNITVLFWPILSGPGTTGIHVLALQGPLQWCKRWQSRGSGPLVQIARGEYVHQWLLEAAPVSARWLWGGEGEVYGCSSRGWGGAGWHGSKEAYPRGSCYFILQSCILLLLPQSPLYHSLPYRHVQPHPLSSPEPAPWHLSCHSNEEAGLGRGISRCRACHLMIAVPTGLGRVSNQLSSRLLLYDLLVLAHWLDVGSGSFSWGGEAWWVHGWGGEPATLPWDK